MKKRRINKISTIEGCQLEIARLYREARREELDLARAKSLTWIIKELSGLIRDGDIEKRLEQVELELNIT